MESIWRPRVGAWCSRVLSILFLLGIAPHFAKAGEAELWGVGPGDRVFAAQRSGSTLYIAGNFASVGPNSGGGVPLDVARGRPLDVHAKIAGRVNAVIPDGRGGWFVAGNFPGVDGIPRANVAHLLGNKLDQAWDAKVNGEVLAIERSGHKLFIGGLFDSVGGEAQQYIAAVSLESGGLVAPFIEIDGPVTALKTYGSTMLVGGSFLECGGAARHNLAACDLLTGIATSWNPSPDGRVLAFAVKDTTIYVGGYFDFIAGEFRQCLAALGAETGAATSWSPNLSRTPDIDLDGGPRVSCLLLVDSLLYVAGSFKKIGGQLRQGLAALSVSTALASSWNPRAYSEFVFGAYFNAIASSGDTLFVSGQADSIGGSVGSYLAAVSLSTGTRIAWDPRPNWEVFSLAYQGGVLFAAGGFSSMTDWVARRNVAALDLTNGAVLPWDPEADDFVNTLQIEGSTVYLGGVFSSVGGLPRGGLAAVDAATGVPTAWNPSVSGGVNALARWGDALIVGGRFGAVGGVPRANLAAVDVASGGVLPWDPQVNDIVFCLAPTESLIYIGGLFSAVGGVTRRTLAAVEPLSGMPSAWAPNTDAYVKGMLSLDGTIYVCGGFSTVANVARSGLAAIGRDGEVLPWGANADGSVVAMTALDSIIYVSGSFGAVEGTRRSGLAALNARTGKLEDWDPVADGVLWGIYNDGCRIYPLGAFGCISFAPHSGLAAVSPVIHGDWVRHDEIVLAQSVPNPASTNTTIRFQLPRPSDVNLTIFDVSGRLIAANRTFQQAGWHETQISTAAWPPGFYVYRLQAGQRSVSKKMMVVR